MQFLSSVSRKSIEQMIQKGLYEKALQLVAEFEEREDVCDDDFDNNSCRLNICILKSELLVQLGKYQDAINLAEKNILDCTKQENDILAFYALVPKAKALSRLGKLDDSLKVITIGEQLISKFQKDEFEDSKSQIATLINIKGNLFNNMGDYDQALDQYQKSIQIRSTQDQEIRDKVGTAASLNNIGLIFRKTGDLNQALNYYEQSLSEFELLDQKAEIGLLLNNIGQIYRLQGELDRSLQYYNRSLSIYKEINNKERIAGTLENIGILYSHMSELDKSLSFLQEALDTIKKIGNDISTSYTLFYIIQITLAQEDKEKTSFYFSHLQELHDKNDNKQISIRYRLINSLILKNTKRMKNIVKAQNILTKIVAEDIIIHELTVIAMLNLCEILLLELKSLNNEESLIEANELVSKLIKIAKSQNSTSLFVESYILQSKFALLEGNFKKSYSLLEQAISIAKEKGLTKYVNQSMEEQKALQTQLDKWKLLFKQNASMYEKIEQTKVIEYIDEIKKQLFE